MAHYSSTTGELSQRGPSCDSQRPRRSLLWISYQFLSKTWPIGNGSSSTRTPIHLDNDSLLNIFHFCRPALRFSRVNDADVIGILRGRNWNRERWWYNLVQVCRRWRYLVLESASLLGLSLLCTYGTSVADVLAHLPPLPLIIDYLDLHGDLTTEDELGIILALWHCDRVRCIRLVQPAPVLQRLFMILQGEFPNLEYLIIERHPSEYTIVGIPKTFQAPRLRYLVVMGLEIPVRFLSTTIIGNPVVLSLKFNSVDSDYYLHPNVLLQQPSFVPQRETPRNTFNSYLPSDDVDGQSLQRAITRRVTPYLRCFGFQGANAYLKMLLPQVTILLLERLQLYFFDQLTYLIPRRLQFVSVEIPRLNTVTLDFDKDYLCVYAFPQHGLVDYTLSMVLNSRHLDFQVARAAQVFHILRTAFSVVEHLTLKYYRHSISSEWNNEADRAQWRELLRTFGNAKTLSMEYGLIGKLSRSLQPGEGESPTDLLPVLQELFYSAVEPSDDAFAPFIEARQKADRLVTVIHSNDI